jgi:hypothetical protein
MKNKLILLGLIFLSCCVPKRRETIQSERKTILKPNERIVDISFYGDHLWIIVHDTINGKIMARPYSVSHHEREVKIK